MEDFDQEETIYTLKNWLLDPPNFGIFSQDQTKCIITSSQDILFLNLDNGFEHDIDENENIKDILNILSDDTHFYILANKRHNFIGYYLLTIEINDPEKEATYLINWTNKTTIR